MVSTKIGFSLILAFPSLALLQSTSGPGSVLNYDVAETNDFISLSADSRAFV